MSRPSLAFSRSASISSPACLGSIRSAKGGFFAIGAYLTTIVVNELGWNVFLMLFESCLVVSRRESDSAVGFLSLRVSGLYFAITTFIFTLVLTVLATDLKITGGLQGLLGSRLSRLSRQSCLARRAGRLVRDARAAALRRRCLEHSAIVLPRFPYPVLLSISGDAERFAEAAGVRTSLIKIGVFGVSAAMAGGAGLAFFLSWASYRPANSTGRSR